LLCEISLTEKLLDVRSCVPIQMKSSRNLLVTGISQINVADQAVIIMSTEQVGSSDNPSVLCLGSATTPAIL
jgi:hypothetical protein